MLSNPKEGPAAPTRKNVGSMNPSKEQGARSKAGSELPGLICIGFHRISSIFIEFDEIRRFVRFLERMLAACGGELGPHKKECWIPES